MNTRVILVLLVILLAESSEESAVQQCHRNLDEVLLPNFHQCYGELLQQFSSLSEDDLGSMVCLTGKMHLFGVQPDQPRVDYLLANYFIKLAAEVFEIAECRYYLGIMYNYKMTPHFTIQRNLAARSNKTSSEVALGRFVAQMHLTHSELSLYLASLDKQPQSMMVLANQNRRGISTSRNCTAAALYYIELVKQVYVEDFLEHSFYKDRQNFEQELYLRKRINTDTLVENEAYIVEETVSIGMESYMASSEIAQNYYYGRNGFRRNYTKAVEMFEKLTSSNSHESSLLGICYFKGLGTKQDYEKALELFQSSSRTDLSKFMLAVMEYYGIVLQKNTASAIKKFKELSATSPQAKAFYGSLIIKGLVTGANYKDGMTLLEEASSMGNQHAKMIIGLIYLDGVSLSYDCDKGIGYLFDSLIIVDSWWDKVQNAKQALHVSRPDMALFKYIELAMVGDSVGMVNGLYLLETFEEILDIPENVWNYSRIHQDPFFKMLQKEGYKVAETEHFLYGDFFQFASLRTIRELLKFTKSTREDYRNYIKDKLLFVCREIGDSICKFISYKQKQDISLLKELANHHSNDLHILESRYLMGKKHQESNRTEQAKAMYRFATGSWMIAELIWYLEGGELKVGILDDFFIFASIIILLVGIAYVHRNMTLIKIQERHNQTKQEAPAAHEPSFTEPPNSDERLPEERDPDQPVIETEEGTSSTWLRQKDD